MSNESILLSDERKRPQCTICDHKDSYCKDHPCEFVKGYPEGYEAGFTEAVQFMEGKCTEHIYKCPEYDLEHIADRRVDCPKCREKYHKELNIP